MQINEGLDAAFPPNTCVHASLAVAAVINGKAETSAATVATAATAGVGAAAAGGPNNVMLSRLMGGEQEGGREGGGEVTRIRNCLRATARPVN